MGSRKYRLFGTGVALLIAIAVAAFGAGGAVASSSGGVASIAKLVPAAIKAKGTLSVAADGPTRRMSSSRAPRSWAWTLT